MRISDWSSDVCSSDLPPYDHQAEHGSDADGRKSEKGEHTIGSGRLVDDACDKGEQRLRSIHGGAHQSYGLAGVLPRSEEHTSELQSLMRISYAVFCLKKKNKYKKTNYRRKQIKTAA